MSKTVRARYTLEFKQEAVRLVHGGQSIAAAARYNRARLHSTLAYVSPMQFEQDWHAAQARQASS